MSNRNKNSRSVSEAPVTRQPAKTEKQELSTLLAQTYPFIWGELTFAPPNGAYEQAEGSLCMLADVLGLRRRSVLSNPAGLNIDWKALPLAVLQRLGKILEVRAPFTLERVLNVLKAYIAAKETFPAFKTSVIHVTRKLLTELESNKAYHLNKNRLTYLKTHLARQSIELIVGNLKLISTSTSVKQAVTFDTLPNEIISRIVDFVAEMVRAEVKSHRDTINEAAEMFYKDSKPPKRKVNALRSLMLVNKTLNRLATPHYWRRLSLSVEPNPCIRRLASVLIGIGKFVKELDLDVMDATEALVPPFIRREWAEERSDYSMTLLGHTPNLRRLSINFLGELREDQWHFFLTSALPTFSKKLQQLRLCAHPRNLSEDEEELDEDNHFDDPYDVHKFASILTSLKEVHTLDLHQGSSIDSYERLDNGDDMADVDLLQSIFTMPNLHCLELNQPLSLYSESWASVEDELDMEAAVRMQTTAKRESAEQCTGCGSRHPAVDPYDEIDSTWHGFAANLHHLTLRSAIMEFDLLQRILNRMPALSTLQLLDSPREYEEDGLYHEDLGGLKLTRLLNLILDDFDSSHPSTIHHLWKLLRNVDIYTLSIGYAPEISLEALKNLVKARKQPLHKLKAIQILNGSHIECCSVREMLRLFEDELGIKTLWSSDAQSWQEIIKELVKAGEIPDDFCWQEVPFDTSMLPLQDGSSSGKRMCAAE